MVFIETFSLTEWPVLQTLQEMATVMDMAHAFLALDFI